MAKYLLLWTVDYSRTPEEPEVRKQQWLKMQHAVSNDVKSGKLSDWGLFVGEGQGYCVLDGSAKDVDRLTRKYTPYIHFEVKQTQSIEDTIENTEEM